ncbi:hypothetical protein MMC25_003939 [Agyrium rufum]|nr:hypothetical protein [Agyrium rufum]
MSFGFSPSDIISLIQLTTKTYQKWKNACGEYTRLTGELRSLQVILQALEEEVRVPTSLLRHHDNGLRRLATITSDCSMIVRELNVIITNHKSLGSSRARNWDRLKFGHTHLTGLLQRLQSQLTALGTYLDVLGAGSLGRLEESVRNLPEMKRVIDDIAAQMRCGRREGTVMTDYGDDDKEVWRAFRRELISEGFSSKDLQKAKGTLSGYLKRMKDAGLFEEETLQETTTEDRAFTISEVLSESTEEFPVGSAAIDDAEPRVYIMNSGIDPRDLRKFRSGDQDFHSILSFGPDIVSISEASLASPLNCLYGRKFTMYRNCILNGETPPKISTVDDLESYIYSIALQRVNLFKVDPAYDNVNLSNKVVVILHVWLFRQPETEWNAGTWVSDYSVDTVCDPTDKRAIMLPALRASWRPDLKFYTHSPLRDNSSVDEDTDQSRPGYSAIFSGEGDAVKPPVTIGSKPHDAINHYLMDLASPSKTDFPHLIIPLSSIIHPPILHLLKMRIFVGEAGYVARDSSV